MCAIRQPRRCQANRDPGCVGGTEFFSHSSTPKYSARVGIEAALKRVKDQAATQAPVPKAMFEAAHVRVSQLEAALEATGEFRPVHQSSTIGSRIGK